MCSFKKSLNKIQATQCPEFLTKNTGIMPNVQCCIDNKWANDK